MLILSNRYVCKWTMGAADINHLKLHHWILQHYPVGVYWLSTFTLQITVQQYIFAKYKRHVNRYLPCVVTESGGKYRGYQRNYFPLEYVWVVPLSTSTNKKTTTSRENGNGANNHKFFEDEEDEDVELDEDEEEENITTDDEDFTSFKFQLEIK